MALICRYLRAVIFVLIVALVLSVAGGVFFRYALQQSLYWGTEVPNFLFVWIVFLGAVIAYHEKKHIAFTALVELLQPRSRALVEIFTLVMVLAFFAFLVITGFMVVRQTMGSPSEALKIPLGLVYSCAPLACVLMAIDTLDTLRDRLRTFPR